MLVITGTQRSGTSLVAKMFQHDGYDLGTTWWDDEVDGGLENPNIALFYRLMLGVDDFPFEGFRFPVESELVNPEKEARSRFQMLQYICDVVKFSYLLMNPAFVYLWHKHREGIDDRFLVCYRNKRNVWKSKMRHREVFARDTLLLQQRPVTMNGNFDTSLKVLGECGYPYYVLRFEELLKGPDELNDAMDMLGYNYVFSQETYNAVVDLSKVHYIEEG